MEFQPRGCYNLSPCIPLPESLHDLLLNGIIDKFHHVKLHKHVVLTINNRLIAFLWASLVAQLIKNLPTMQETWVRSLLGKIPWTRKQQSIPVLLPGKFHGQRSRTGCSAWNCKELDTTVQLTFTFSQVEVCRRKFLHSDRLMENIMPNSYVNFINNY